MKDFLIKAFGFDKHKVIGLLIALGIGAIFALLSYRTNLLSGLESGSIDFRFYMRAPSQRSDEIAHGKVQVRELNPRVNPNIAIVAIDEESISQIGAWPWPWQVHANFIKTINLSTNPPNAILFDIFFIDHKTLFSYDAEKVLRNNLTQKDVDKILSFNRFNEEVLSQAIKGTQNVFLDYPFFSEKTNANMLDYQERLTKLNSVRWPVPKSDQNASWVRDVILPLLTISGPSKGIGFANIRYEKRQSVNRRMPMVIKYQKYYYPNIDLILAMNYFGITPKDVDIKIGEAIYLRNIPPKLIKVENPDQFQRLKITSQGKLATDSMFTYKFYGDSQNDHWGKALGNTGFAARISFELENAKSLMVKNLKIEMFSLKNPKSKAHLITHMKEFTINKRKEVTLGKDVLIAFVPKGNELYIESNLQGELNGEIDRRDVLLKPNKERVVRIPVDEEGFMLINFVGGQESFTSYSYSTFVPKLSASQKEMDEHFKTFKDFTSFDDKILMIAIYKALGLVDVHKSPYGPMFGIEHHANALNTVLNQDFLHEVSIFGNIVIMLIVGLLLGWLLPRVSIIINAVVSFVVVIVFVIVAQLFFNQQSVVFAMAAPLLQIIFIFTGITVFRVLTEEKKSRYIRNTFSKFVSKAVVNELLSDPDKIQLGGEDREITIFFSDIRGFTTISEALTPQELVQLLNEYLSEMTDLIITENGTLDKYMGDAIMAFWGAPLPMEDHAIRACRTSLVMMEKLKVMQQRWLAEGRPPIDIGIGLNTGNATVGNMGSSNRMDYTCMGDTINLGSRLEGINKVYGTNIVMSEYTYNKVKDKVISRELDLIKVKGKTQPVRIYELLAMKEEMNIA